MAQELSTRRNVLVLIFIFLVLLVVAVLMTNSNSSSVVRTKEHVLVKTTDLYNVTKESQKIPEGFPPSIPLESKKTVESYSMNFPERKLTQYTVNYKTQKSQTQKYQEYLDFMTKNGFAFGPEGKNAKTGTLFAAKNGDDLLVVTTQVGDETSVQIAYVDRN